MLDIDNFKRVNDTYGHQQGDLVLREVARVLRETSREIDEPARYGGEEMAVVLPGTDLEAPTTSPSACARRSRRSSCPCSTASGDAAGHRAASAPRRCRRRGADKDALIAAADAALYEAKRAGKNRTGVPSRAGG